MRCLWCGQVLHWVPDRGWTHRGGGIYVQRCGRCGLRAAVWPSQLMCPNCGEVVRWVDDHCATPVPLRELRGEREHVQQQRAHLSDEGGEP